MDGVNNMQKILENIFRWVKINTDIEGFDYYKVLKELRNEIDKKLEDEV